MKLPSLAAVRSVRVVICRGRYFTASGTSDHVRARVQAYIAAGASKFVMRPCGPLDGWREQVEILAREVIAPLQTSDYIITVWVFSCGRWSALPRLLFFSAAQSVTSFVGFRQRKGLKLRPHRHKRRQRQELFSVRSCEVGDGAEPSAPPKEWNRETTGCRSCGYRRRPQCRLCYGAERCGTSSPAGRR